MKLIYNGDHFAVISKYSERHIPKEAGFRWDAFKRQWWTNDVTIAAKLINYADAQCKAKIEELLKQREEALKASRAISVDIELPAPEGLDYLPFQKAGIAYALKRDSVLIADEMGCVSGDATIVVNRASCARKITIRDLYFKFNGLKGRWDKNILTMTRCLVNGELRLRPILGVYFKGVKKTIKITTNSGKSLKLTPDHLVCTPNGWIEAEKLKIGDIVLTNGTMICKRCGSDKDIITYKNAKFKGYCKTCMYRILRKNTTKDGKYVSKTDGYVYVTSGVRFHPYKPKTEGIPEHKLVVEAAMNGMTLEEWLEVIKEGKFTKEHIFLPPDLEVHHKNGIRTDNRLENLMVVDKKLHKELDKAYRRLPVFLPKEEVITNIEDGGEIDVYDLTVAEGHSFIANGIIVHNCGKTIQAIGVINADQSLNKIIIVCPASLKLNWAKELDRWLVRNLSVSVIKDNFVNTDIVILNYDILHKFEKEIQSIAWDCLIVDEAHYIKNPKTRRSRQVRSINARKKIFLTGTPIVNRPVELWPIISYLDPKTWNNFMKYAFRYCNAYYNGYGWDFRGASNLEELQEKLRATIMIRRLKKDVLAELPPKRRQIIELPANGLSKYVQQEWAAWEKYQEKLSELLAVAELAKTSESEEEYKEAIMALKSGIKVAFEEMSKMRLQTAMAKVPLLIEHIKMVLESEEKVVVFAHHREVIKSIADVFGSDAVVVTGETSIKSRQEAVERFQNDPSCRLFIGSIGAAGVGFTLTASRTVIFAELDWVPGNVTQAEDRCHRIGQQSSVLIQHIVLEGSIDATIAKTLVKKQEVIEKALDKEVKTEIETIPLLPIEYEQTPKKQIESEAISLTERQIEAIHKALKILASLDVDHATAVNYVGFNKVDSRIGHELARRDKLTPKQAALGKRIVLKYHRQLPSELLDIIRGGIINEGLYCKIRK